MHERKTTSTFTIHHDRCDPSKWTAADVLKLAHYVKWGDLASAAALSRLGLQLVLDERHETKGGDIEQIGFAHPESLNEFTEDWSELDPDDDVFPVVRVYRGHEEWAVRYGIGDGEGNFECYEYEIKDSEAEARAFNDALRAPGPADDRNSAATVEGGD